MKSMSICILPGEVTVYDVCLGITLRVSPKRYIIIVHESKFLFGSEMFLTAENDDALQYLYTVSCVGCGDIVTELK